MHTIRAKDLKHFLFFHNLRMFTCRKVECANSRCVKRVCEIHSKGSASSVKRSARSATVSTAASDCFMAALLWLQRLFYFLFGKKKKRNLFISSL